jgi:hypothetical protein
VLPAANGLVNDTLAVARARTEVLSNSASTLDSFRNSGTGVPLETRTLLELSRDEELKKPRTWLIDQLLPLGALVLLHGPPKSGKSTLAAAIAGSVASGTPFSNLNSSAADVLWLDLERGYRVTSERLFESFAPSAMDRCHVYAGRAIQAHDIAATLRNGPFGLVVLDSISRYMRIDDENAAAEMNRAIAPLASLAHELNIAVIGIHHDRKAGGSGGTARRGSGALFAVADMTIQLSREGSQGDPRRRLTIESNIDGVLDTLSITRTSSGFDATGAAGPERKLDRLLNAIGSLTLTAEEIARRLGLSRQAIAGDLELGVSTGALRRSGSGKKNDPARFSRNAIGAASAANGAGVEELRGRS